MSFHRFDGEDIASSRFAIIDYDGSPAHRASFKAINRQWIAAMFALEPADEAVLDHPDTAILAGGGAILFVEMPGKGLVGTAALRKQEDGAVELTKMGVLETARGSGAGAALLAAAIRRGVALASAGEAATLYLLTNHRCEAAIHLYERAGFLHDATIQARYGARYRRCDVAMRYSR